METKPYPHLREELYKLNWIKILDTAIKSRKLSWYDPAVREWRNASDEVCFAVIHALEDEGLIETILERIDRIRKEWKPK